jgi:hypothetical protein
MQDGKERARSFSSFIFLRSISRSAQVSRAQPQPLFFSSALGAGLLTSPALGAGLLTSPALGVGLPASPALGVGLPTSPALGVGLLTSPALGVGLPTSPQPLFFFIFYPSSFNHLPIFLNVPTLVSIDFFFSCILWADSHADSSQRR